MPRYIFIPYSPNSKIDCPYCNGKKKFVRFVDTESGEVMPTEFGRCDRENGCGYYRHPFHGTSRPVQKTEQAPILDKPQVFIPKSIVADCMKFYDNNKFLKLLETKIDSKKIHESVQKYFIGTSKIGGITYFSINHKHKITSCKIITYDGFNRSKDIAPYYPYKKEDGYYSCLFGMHLIDKNKKIKIVESEKTAFIASMFYPEYVWMSGGGTTGMTANKCALIKESGYTGTIDLISDCDKSGREAVIKWKDNLMAFNIESNIIELDSNLNNGEDLADLLWNN
jgi:hypothetical protein